MPQIRICLHGIMHGQQQKTVSATIEPSICSVAANVLRKPAIGQDAATIGFRGMTAHGRQMASANVGQKPRI